MGHIRHQHLLIASNLISEADGHRTKHYMVNYGNDKVEFTAEKAQNYKHFK